MSARLIDGKAIAADVRSEIATEVERIIAGGGRRPGLATVLVGDDPASAVYVANKHRACAEVGFEGFHHELPAEVDAEEVAGLLRELNAKQEVDGILLQLPLPSGLDAASLTALIDPAKDVDGLTPANAGALTLGRPGLRPCTPSGVIELLDREGVTIAGASSVIVGRSDLVGRPLASLLLARDATVTVCHSRTADLAAECRRAEILVVAVGRAGLVKGDWVKPGATVIDVGMNRVDGVLVGDIDFEPVREIAGLITPVPGGVGPMTIAMLLRNTLQAAAGRAGAP